MKRLLRWLTSVFVRLVHSNTARIVAWIVFVLIGTTVFSIVFWDWLDGTESGSATVRNLGLLVVAIIGLPLAIWRSRVAERQADTAQRGLLNERYQVGAQMLGSDLLPVRLGGIYALARLAREHPRDYHTQIMNLLCSFVLHPDKKASEVKAHEKHRGRSKGVENVSSERQQPVRQDVQEAMTAIGSRSKAQIKIEREEDYHLNLSGAYLVDVSMEGENLTGADLSYANLTKAGLEETNLSGVNMMAANLTDAVLCDAIMHGAWLGAANLTRVEMGGCEGLTQRRLDLARADSANPPKLDDALDGKSGRPLTWRGSEP